MPVVTRNLSLSAAWLICAIILSQADLASGGVVPLPRDGMPLIQPQEVDESVPAIATAAAPSSLFSDSLRSNTVVPVMEMAPTLTHASAPAAVPLPPALETGLSGGIALMLAAGLRKLRRAFRRGF